MVICPNSTPILNDKSEDKNWFFGNPISLKAFANPKPWINPNPKINAIRQGFILSWTIFSMAVKSIETATTGKILILLKPYYFYINALKGFFQKNIYKF